MAYFGFTEAALGTAEQAEQTAAVLTRLGDTITTFLITEQANPDAG